MMTPLQGTRTSSAPVGAKSGGNTRAARSLLFCALWRGMGRLWRGMGGMGRPEPLSAPATAPFGFSRDTKHESRPLCFSRITASLPTISHHFPRFPGISRPPPPPSANQVSTRRPPFLVSRPDCRAARSLLSCALWGGMGRLWRGMGGGRPPHRQHGLSGFHETRDHESRLFSNHGLSPRQGVSL